MEITTLALFIMTFGSILILPGPNSAFAVGQSLKYGAMASLVVSLGFMSATGLHALLVFSGIGLIVQEYSLLLSALKWLGIIYLLWLAYKSFTANASNIKGSSIKEPGNKLSSNKESGTDIPKLKMFSSAMLVSLTNPKALLASLMIYPLFLNSEQGYLSQAVILTLTAMAISFSIYAGYSLAASALKRRLAANALASNKLGSKMSANKLVGSLYLAAAGALASK